MLVFSWMKMSMPRKTRMSFYARIFMDENEHVQKDTDVFLCSYINYIIIPQKRRMRSHAPFKTNSFGIRYGSISELLCPVPCSAYFVDCDTACLKATEHDVLFVCR